MQILKKSQRRTCWVLQSTPLGTHLIMYDYALTLFVLICLCCNNSKWLKVTYLEYRGHFLFKSQKKGEHRSWHCGLMSEANTSNVAYVLAPKTLIQLPADDWENQTRLKYFAFGHKWKNQVELVVFGLVWPSTVIAVTCTVNHWMKTIFCNTL